MHPFLRHLLFTGAAAWALAAGHVPVFAAESCRITTPPAKTPAQQLKERALWGKWESFDERFVEVGAGGGSLPAGGTPGVRYHLLSKRPGQQPDTTRPLVVFLHGFPELAWAWERELKLVGDTHDAIAIDLKGHGESDKPAELSNYDFKRLVDEIDAVARCLGYTRDAQVIPVGHDFGGSLAWLYAIYHPQRTKAAVVLSTPHPYTFFRELAKPDSEQRKRSHYIDLVRENTTASMLEYFVGLTKDTSLFGEFWRWPRVNRMLTNNMDAYWKWNRMFSYYRVLDLPPDPAFYADQPGPLALSIFSVRVPVLAFYGAADPYFAAQSWEGVGQFVPRLEFHAVPGAGHFINHDVVDIGQKILDFVDANSAP